MITKRFKSLSSETYIFSSYHDRLYMYLSYIDILLVFRHLAIKNATLEELSDFFQVKIDRKIIRAYHKKILGLFADLRTKWKASREQACEHIYFNLTIDVLNSQVTYPQSCSKEKLIEMKQRSISYCKRYFTSRRVKTLKSRESWIKALCLFTAQEVFTDRSINIFPTLVIKDLKLLHHKVWQIRKELSLQ